mgnify:CR=1 FL=1
MDNTNHVFTATVADGQLVLSVPIAAVDNHDDFSTWVSENSEKLDEVCSVAIESEEIAATLMKVAPPVVQVVESSP